MALDVYKALKHFKKTLAEDWSKINFNFEIKGEDDREQAWATADVTINGFDDDIRLIFTAYSGGGVEFRAVFDKIDKTREVLELVHEFNRSTFYFKMFVREDDAYLEIKHAFICDDVDQLDSYISECLCRIVDMNENDIVKTLSAYTHS